MGHYYFDSSALVKRYVTEAGTAWVNNLCAPSTDHVLYTVRISGAEIIAALFLRARTGSLAMSDVQAVAVRFKLDFRQRYQIVEVTEPLVNSAMVLAEKHGLRGYDAIQLAAAVELQAVRASVALSVITLVSADDKLNMAAVTESLLVENPNDH